MITRFILQRALSAIPVLLIVSLLMFAIFQLMPGTYCDEPLSGQRQAICNELRERFGLSDPFYVQYARWVQNILLKGDFGPSLAPPFQPAFVAIAGEGRFVNSVLIAALTLLFALCVSVPTALYSAIRPYSPGERIFSFLSVLGLSIPSFLMGVVLLELLVDWFQVGRRWGLLVTGLPDLGTAFASLGHFGDFLWRLWPIVLIAGTWQTAEAYRQMRGVLLEICADPVWRGQLRQARTTSEHCALYAQAVGNAFAALASWFGLWLPLIFEGTMIAGIVLSVPVMEFALWTAVRREDVYVALAGLVIFSSLLIAANLIVDLLWIVGSQSRIRYD